MSDHPLFAPATLAGRPLRTRLVLPPMASGTGSEAGHVTDATIAHYQRLLAANHHGLAFVEYTYVAGHGRSEPHQLGLTGDAHIPGLARLAAAIRATGAVPGLQLTHAGGKTDEAMAGRAPLGASALPIPAHGGDMPPPVPMTTAEAAAVGEAFVAAALRAEAAGFGAIEIHAVHGYFFNQWLSPLTNQRFTTLADRARLLLGVVTRMRAVLKPETLISVRFPGQDRLPGGLTVADGIWLAEALAARGVDVLDVSSGLGGWRRGRDQRGEGYLVADAAALRAAVGVPVIGVGGVATLDYARAALAEVDFLAVGRAVLENPAWPQAAPAVAAA